MGAVGNSKFTLPSHRIGVCADTGLVRRFRDVTRIHRAMSGFRPGGAVSALMFALLRHCVRLHADAALKSGF